jgi:Flp pilus assembly secretin CpaC
MKQQTQLRDVRIWAGACVYVPLWLILIIIAIAATALPATAKQATRAWQAGSSLVVPEGQALMLHMVDMRRVQVTNPDVADVVISSIAQLVVYGKKRGVTTLYVWDRRGLHEFDVCVTGQTAAEKTAEGLAKALGDDLTYTTVGEDLLLIEGSVEDSERLERTRRVIAGRRGPVTLIDLVVLEGAKRVPAANAAAKALEEVFGDKIEYVVLDESRLVVQGDLSDEEEVARVGKVITAVTSEGLKIVNLVQYNDELATPPLDKIRAAVGEDLKVWQVKGRTVAIDGTVSSEQEYERLGKVLAAFVKDANPINLVRVVKPRSPISEYARELQEAFGPDIEVKQMGPETLALEGTVTSLEMAKHYQDLLTVMDPPYHVVDYLRVVAPYKERIEIAVLVAEIDNTDMDELGVEWGQIRGNDVEQPVLIGIENGVRTIGEIGAALDLLLQDSNSRVLSRPKVMVNDGEQAEILIGGEVPIPVLEPSAGGVATVTIQYKPYGVQLYITPTLKNDGKTIDMDINPVVSSLDWTNSVTISGFNIPAMRSSEVTTKVSLVSGGMLTLGGLLQREQAEIVRKIPVLSDIPIIGNLFKHKSFSAGDTELVIFVSPRIATDAHHEAGYEHPLDKELEEMRQIPE